MTAFTRALYAPRCQEGSDTDGKPRRLAARDLPIRSVTAPSVGRRLFRGQRLSGAIDRCRVSLSWLGSGLRYCNCTIGAV